MYANVCLSAVAQHKVISRHLRVASRVGANQSVSVSMRVVRPPRMLSPVMSLGLGVALQDTCSVLMCMAYMSTALCLPVQVIWSNTQRPH